MKEIFDMLMNNGATIALLAYFIYKDYKFTEKITQTLSSIDNSLKGRRKNNE